MKFGTRLRQWRQMRSLNFSFVSTALIVSLVIIGCGYHTVGSASHLPSTVRTLAVPTFVNLTQSFHTEVAMTQAVIREFTTRTTYKVISTNDASGGETKVSANAAALNQESANGASANGASANQVSANGADATVHGTILTEAVSPLTYNSQTGQSSSFLITVTAKVIVTDRNNRILYQNARYSFRQQYQSSSDLTSFIQEDPSAIARLSKDFAQSLVSDILESF